MSNYCPEWIFGICGANTSKEFLSSNNSIAAISKKYSTTLSEKYNEIRFEEILDLSENILQFLSDINAGEEAVLFLDGFIYFRLNYETTTKPRNLKPMFGNPEAGVPAVNQIDVLKRFKAYVFGLRSNNSPTPPPGWNVARDSENLKNVSALVTTSINPLDFL